MTDPILDCEIRTTWLPGHQQYVARLWVHQPGGGYWCTFSAQDDDLVVVMEAVWRALHEATARYRAAEQLGFRGDPELIYTDYEGNVYRQLSLLDYPLDKVGEK